LARNSLADYLRDPRCAFDGFHCDVKNLLFSFYRRTQRIRGFAIMRCANLLLTFTLTMTLTLTESFTHNAIA